jgi:hypothetical protein
MQNTNVNVGCVSLDRMIAGTKGNRTTQTSNPFRALETGISLADRKLGLVCEAPEEIIVRFTKSIGQPD